MNNLVARYGVPFAKPKPVTRPSGAAIAKPDAEPSPSETALTDASSAAVDLFTAAMQRADISELARLLAVTLGAIARLGGK